MVCSAEAPAEAGERTPRDIQQALSNKGFNPGKIDGLWGKRSANALREFQKANGLAATGTIDDATTTVLFPEHHLLDHKSGKPSLEADSRQTDPDLEPIPPSKAASNEKRGRIPAKVDASQKKSVLDIPTVSETTLPEVEVGANERSESKKAGRQPMAVYLVASIILATFILLMRRSKGTSPTAPSPRQVDPVPAAPPVSSRTPKRRNNEPAVKDAALALPAIPTLSLAAHNDALTGWVRQNADKNPSRPSPADNDALTTIEERGSAPGNEQRASLVEHNAAVKQWVADNAAASRRRYDESQRQSFGIRTTPLADAAVSSEWKAKDTQVTIAGITISKGLIYVGKSLGKHRLPYDAENCLVNPGLKVGQWGDREGLTMGYWPSYSSISPEARRSYLGWLAGDRSDPDTYIGYVFLYFYGLERRLMLESDVPDAAIVANEVRRLLDVYGGNHSFNRYATELLTAVELRSGEPSARFLARVEPNGYEVPTAIQIALGVRVRDGRIMEPDLLYRFAMTHPETRARTPAKRAPELMRQLFSEQMSREYPSGFRYKVGRAKPLQKHYKACSGSFQVDIDILGGNIPDIAHHAQPIGTARRIFDACSDALDDYSRALSRLPGLIPNLMAVSRLPKALRAQQADLLEDRPLDRIALSARDATLSTVAEIARTAGIDIGTSTTKPKLRELSQLLAAFGYGVTFDPAYATKTLSGNDPALVFQIDAETTAEPTEHYRRVQLAVMLGLVIGHADGHFDDSERDALLKRIEREPWLSTDERSRLRAEIRVNEVHPDRLEEWMKRLKDVAPDARLSVADELIFVASADGNLHAAEIRKLELIFKRLGLSSQSLYDRLHSGSNSGGRLPATSSKDSAENAPVAKHPTRIDLSKLHSIRSETHVTATVLADIFADDDAGTAEPSVVQADAAAPESDIFEGLERRYGALLNELRLQGSWSAPDFERLTRDAGLMPGAAREAINDWGMERFDELLIEGDDPVEISLHLLASSETAISAGTGEGIPA